MGIFPISRYPNKLTIFATATLGPAASAALIQPHRCSNAWLWCWPNFGLILARRQKTRTAHGVIAVLLRCYCGVIAVMEIAVERC